MTGVLGLPPICDVPANWRWHYALAWDCRLSLTDLTQLGQRVLPHAENAPLSQFLAWSLLEQSTYLWGRLAREESPVPIALGSSFVQAFGAQLVRKAKIAYAAPEFWLVCFIDRRHAQRKMWRLAVRPAHNHSLRNNFEWWVAEGELKKKATAHGQALVPFCKQFLPAGALSREILTDLSTLHFHAPKGYQSVTWNLRRSAQMLPSKQLHRYRKVFVGSQELTDASAWRKLQNPLVIALTQQGQKASVLCGGSKPRASTDRSWSLDLQLEGPLSQAQKLLKATFPQQEEQPSLSTSKDLRVGSTGQKRQQLLRQLLERQDLRRLFVPLVPVHGDWAKLSLEELILGADLSQAHLVDLITSLLKAAQKLPRSAREAAWALSLWQKLLTAQEELSDEAV